MKNKTDLRMYAKDLRKSLDIKLISEKLVSLIRQSAIYNNAKNVMIFYPKKYEVDLLDLLNDDKNFYLPKVSGEFLLVCPYSKDLVEAKFKIMEPCTDPVDPAILDLVIVPALMCDKKGYRLGYGGGFYDRFLKSCQAKTMVAIPNELLIDELPFETYDIKIDEIIAK